MSTIDPSGPFTVPPPPPPPPPFGGGASSQPPGDVGSIKIFFLVSLIVNATAALIWLLSVLGIGAATCGIGCLLIFIPALPIISTVLDAMAMSKMGQPPTPAIHSFLRTTAILDIVSGVVGMSVVPLVMGILCLVYLQKPDVTRYYGASA